jgi:integrase
MARDRSRQEAVDGPAERMKGRREHRVPLSDATVTLLQSLPNETDNPYLFLGSRQQGLSNAAMSELLKRMSYKDANGKSITVHGFRSTFADWCSEQTAFDEQTREFSLAHVTGDASSRAYARSDVLEKRRKLMQAWAGYCQSVPPVAGDA